MSEPVKGPWAPPGPELVEAEASLAAAHERFQGSVGGILSDWQARVSGDVVGPFAEALAHTLQTQEQLQASLARKLSGIAFPEGEENRAAWEASRDHHWEAVTDHVEAVDSRCLAALKNHLVMSDPLVRLAALSAEARKALSEAASTHFPATAVLPTTEAIWDTHPDDGLGLGFRKVLRRTRHAGNRLRNGVGNGLGRLVGRKPSPLGHPARRVAPADVALATVQRELYPLLDAAEASVRAYLATELRKLERSVWKWTIEALRYVDAHDRSQYHVPEDLTLRWPASMRPAQAEAAPDPTFVQQPLLGFEAPPKAPLLVAGQVFENLTRDFETAGTFLYRWLGASLPASSGPIRPFTQDRLELCHALLSLRRTVRTTEERCLAEVSSHALVPIERAYAAIRKRLEEIESSALALVETHGSGPSPKLAEALGELLEQKTDLSDVYRDLKGLSSADEVLSEPGEDAWRGLMKRIAGLPQSLELRGVVGEAPRPYRTDLMQAARQSFERSLPDRLQHASEPLRRAIARVWSETEQVQEVVSNAFHTAIQHLTDDGLEQETPPHSEGEADIGQVLSSGLDRAGDSLEERYQALAPEWSKLVTALHENLTGDWDRAFRTVQSDDFLAKRLLGLQTALTRRGERTWRKLEELWQATSRRSVATARLLRARTYNLIRIGQSAVGVSTSTDEERHLALDTVASARKLYAQLPLVYRRLFSVEPVTDPGLAENRSEDLQDVSELIDRWREGLGSGVVVVHGALGSGRTSFLRLLDLELRERGQTLRIALDRRPANETDLAGLLARALYPEQVFQGDLNALEAIIQERTEERGLVVLVDNLEMLMLQQPGGMELMSRLLLFWIRTDDRIAWCAAAGSLAWDFAVRTAPTSARLAISHQLTPWSTHTLQELILRRHRRSGIALEFLAPEDPSPLVRQRLKRAKTTQDAQRILSGEFFDALTRAAGQSPTRALFEWIRAGTFSEHGDVLRLRPMRPLSFGYLHQFENDSAFTMRAFIFHNSLTVEQHSRLFSTSQATSVMAFETLLSSGLIEPLDPVPGAAIAPGVRYRIRRLVLEPVVRALRERHFIY